MRRSAVFVAVAYGWLPNGRDRRTWPEECLMESCRELVDAGREALKRGDLAAALRASAAGLAADPAWADAVLLRADVLEAAGRVKEAGEVLRGACAAPEAGFEVVLRLAYHCASVNQLEDALAWFEAATKKDMSNPKAWMGIAATAFALRNYDRAAEAAAKARELDPVSYEALEALVTALQYSGRSGEALVYEADADRFAGRAEHGDALALFLFPLLYAGGDGARVLRGHRRFADFLEQRIPILPRGKSLNAETQRRLRIGYFSPEFNTKWSPRFILPWLAAHDPARYETVAYFHSQNPRELERKLPTTGVRNLHGLAGPDAARIIMQDGIDIFVDLAGFSSPWGTNVVACKPAPIVVNYVGYPATSGMTRVDYRLVDSITDPAGDEAFASEELVRLDPCFLCFTFPPNSPPVTPCPSLSRGGAVTFGCFNIMDKVGPPVFEAWARILAALPGSRIVLKNAAMFDAATRGRVHRIFAAAGVDSARVERREFVLDDNAHLAQHHELDIVLDPFPYNGTTTTADALHMGVPVVTLRGNRHAARVGASMLAAAGMPELVASSVDDYVRIAVDLANDEPRRVAMRTTQRQRVMASPLCDAKALARRLEGAYREMWRKWCAGRGALE